MASNKRMISIMVLVGIALSLSAIGIVVASSECIQACQDQYAEDLGVCADAYQQAIGEAAEERQECVAAAQSLIDYMRCEKDYQSAKSFAELERAKCEHAAESTLAQCMVDCSQSPSEL